MAGPKWRLTILMAMLVAGTSCSKEGRTLAAAQPQTPPSGPNDPRIPAYVDNLYQMSQGGRYFIWYGCGTCHTPDAPGSLNLDEQQQGRSLATVYDGIANRHAVKYGDKIPVEQLWQVSAYVLDRAKTDPAKTRRADMDGRGEPEGNTWQGAVK